MEGHGVHTKLGKPLQHLPGFEVIYVWYTFYMYFIETERLGVHTELMKS